MLKADDTIKRIYAYGFIDLEGAKVSHIIAEYDRPVDPQSLGTGTYETDVHVKRCIVSEGYDRAVEIDRDGLRGNEGEAEDVYTVGSPESAENPLGMPSRFVCIRVNTEYMLAGQNLVYTESMACGIRQTADVTAGGEAICASEKLFVNYVTGVSDSPFSRGKPVYTAFRETILLPQLSEEAGWRMHRIGDDAFPARNCYSEYDGGYHDFEMPYAIYVPDKKTLEEYRGNICLVLHMEHAGANDSDPMAAVTSSKAAVMFSSPAFQERDPSIVIVPQIEEVHRTTDDMAASSEANPAIWQLLDSVLKKYRGYIDEERIYATGQSMGGMAALYMASQRDNFFAGIAVAGAQWSNNYDKALQHGGAAARDPGNDPLSFRSFWLDRDNYRNWYYMISDDNILAVTCADDIMATGQWDFTSEYFEAAGRPIRKAMWDPYLPPSEQEELERELLARDMSFPGGGITRIVLSRGTHMSTWKYAYQMEYSFRWLFSRRRSDQSLRGKVEELRNPWLGRDENGRIIPGSGTALLNSAQFTPKGASALYTEGWKGREES